MSHFAHNLFENPLYMQKHTQILNWPLSIGQRSLFLNNSAPTFCTAQVSLSSLDSEFAPVFLLLMQDYLTKIILKSQEIFASQAQNRIQLFNIDNSHKWEHSLFIHLHVHPFIK